MAVDSETYMSVCEQVTRLQAENEVIRARVAELEDGLRDITQYPDVREYVGTICHDAALSALKGSDGAWLLRKQAKAMEVIANKLEGMNLIRPDEFIRSIAKSLRQQADDIEKG